ncbi:MAG: NAD kinase [Bacteroidaceae bacterium]|nr:NAD kinase [Bacteroidaceae bacterium]
MKIAIFGNPSADKTCGHEQQLFSLLQSLGDEIAVESRYYRFLTKEMGWEIPYDSVIEGDDFQADAVISIGGDGTFLRTATRVGSKGIPMVGVNTGRLGFLADITTDRITDAITRIHNGDYTLEERNLLQISMEGLPQGHTPYALNDIAILKHDISSMIQVATSVGGTPMITYQADGLVVATPTGSTAYSLSVGGPIIAPGTNVICLTPVAPHSLTMRPLVLPAGETIHLDVSSRSHSFLVSIDGNSFSCPEHTAIEISRAPFRINVIKPAKGDFFATLREKMFWGTDSRK